MSGFLLASQTKKEGFFLLLFLLKATPTYIGLMSLPVHLLLKYIRESVTTPGVTSLPTPMEDICPLFPKLQVHPAAYLLSLSLSLDV